MLHLHTHTHTHIHKHTRTQTHTHTHIHRAYTESHFISLVFLWTCRNKIKNALSEPGLNRGQFRKYSQVLCFITLLTTAEFKWISNMSYCYETNHNSKMYWPPLIILLLYDWVWTSQAGVDLNIHRKNCHTLQLPAQALRAECKQGWRHSVFSWRWLV